MKIWWKSKTFWLGMVQLFASVATYVGESLANHQFDWADPPQIAFFVSGILTIVFRFFTDKPVEAPMETLNNVRPRIKRNIEARRYRVE